MPCLNSTNITCWNIIWSITTSNVQTSLVIFLCLLGVYCLVFMYLTLDMKFLNISRSKILNCESFQDQFSQSVRDRLNFYTSVTILECSMYFVDCCLWVSVTGPCAATRLRKIRQIVWWKLFPKLDTNYILLYNGVNFIKQSDDIRFKLIGRSYNKIKKAMSENFNRL